MILCEWSIGQNTLISSASKYPRTITIGKDTVVAYTLNQEKDIFKVFVERDKFKELYSIENKLSLKKDTIIGNLEYSLEIQEFSNKLHIEQETLLTDKVSLMNTKIDTLNKDIDILHRENNTLHKRTIKMKRQRNKAIWIACLSTLGMATMTYFIIK